MSLEDANAELRAMARNVYKDEIDNAWDDLLEYYVDMERQQCMRFDDDDYPSHAMPYDWTDDYPWK
jgi:hypothetical protein